MLTLKNDIQEKYKISAQVLLEKLTKVPEIAIIAGSGVNDALQNQIFNAHIDYSEIPYLPETTVYGHKSRISITEINGKSVLVFFGRFHLYEGYTVEETLSLIFLINALGIKKVIITNAAGGLNINYDVGDLMLINDTINFTGKNINHLFSHSKLIVNELSLDSEWMSEVRNKLISNGHKTNTGTYIMVNGPNYETRAEIRMFRKMGGDAVGMSTALELMTAKLLGIEAIGCSIITNMAKDVLNNSVSHQEVLDVAEFSKTKILEFIKIATS